MSLSQKLLQEFSQVPINRYLGLKLLDRSPQVAVVSMNLLPEFTQETGVLHGGIISVIADTAAVYLFAPDLPDGQTMASIEFKINFLHPAVADRGPVLAKSQLIKKGSQVGVAEVSVVQGDILVAKGTFTYLFFARHA